MSDERRTALTTNHSIKKWKCPEGIFVNNFVGHEAIINTMSLNQEGVMFSGGEWRRVDLADRLADNGTLTMWDYATGLPFQHLKDIPQPGSLDAEAVSRAVPLTHVRMLSIVGRLLFNVRQNGHTADYWRSGQDHQSVLRAGMIRSFMWACISRCTSWHSD